MMHLAAPFSHNRVGIYIGMAVNADLPSGLLQLQRTRLSGCPSQSARSVKLYRRACASLCVASMNPAMTWLELSLISCCIHSMAASSFSPSRSFSCTAVAC